MRRHSSPANAGLRRALIAVLLLVGTLSAVLIAHSDGIRATETGLQTTAPAPQGAPAVVAVVVDAMHPAADVGDEVAEVCAVLVGCLVAVLLAWAALQGGARIIRMSTNSVPDPPVVEVRRPRRARPVRLLLGVQRI